MHIKSNTIADVILVLPLTGASQGSLYVSACLGPHAAWQHPHTSSMLGMQSVWEARLHSSNDAQHGSALHALRAFPAL